MRRGPGPRRRQATVCVPSRWPVDSPAGSAADGPVVRDHACPTFNACMAQWVWRTAAQMSGCVVKACWGPTYAAVVWSSAGGGAGGAAAAGGLRRRCRCGIRSERSRGVTAWLHHGGGCKQTLPYPTLNLSRHWADGPHRRPAPQALEEALAPRLRLAGEGAALGSNQTLPHPTHKSSSAPHRRRWKRRWRRGCGWRARARRCSALASSSRGASWRRAPRWSCSGGRRAQWS